MHEGVPTIGQAMYVWKAPAAASPISLTTLCAGAATTPHAASLKKAHLLFEKAHLLSLESPLLLKKTRPLPLKRPPLPLSAVVCCSLSRSVLYSSLLRTPSLHDMWA